MLERRKIKQTEKEGYTIIPHYREKEKFMSTNELKFYNCLKLVLKEIREKNGIKLTIFAQVAVNRLINVNERRNYDRLFKNISERSIDFTLFNEDSNKIYCCIELDDETHEQEKRKLRDVIINNAFNENILLIRIPRQDYYNVEEIKEKLFKNEFDKV